MATQLILTVGTNALPIWVAWYHLKDKLEAPIEVRLVHTTDTQPQKKVLEKYYEGADFLDPIETDSGDPNVVREKIQERILDDFSEGTLHVHYTGGTKVMGVETVSAIEPFTQGNYTLETSYLDPRGDDGPRIVRRSDDPSRSVELVPDTRIGIPVEPEAGEPDYIALERIAELNGFELGEFQHQYHIGGGTYDYKTCPAPGIPTPEHLEAGQIVLDYMLKNRPASYSGRTNFQHIFANRDSLWNEKFPRQHDRFAYPENAGTFRLPNNADPIWQRDLLPVLNQVYSNCQWDIPAGRLLYNDIHTATTAQKTDLEQMDAFFNGTWLEYAAYAALKKVLEGICSNPEGICSNPDRGNYKLFHSVYVRRANAMDLKVRPFELDVVAVLGHQIVVVSCTISGNANTIKQKGIEAYHRAKQLGGDEARAIVLCSAHSAQQPFYQDELRDETGSPDVPLQVWGSSEWENLTGKFTEYLTQDLRWK